MLTDIDIMMALSSITLCTTLNKPKIIPIPCPDNIPGCCVMHCVEVKGKVNVELARIDTDGTNLVAEINGDKIVGGTMDVEKLKEVIHENLRSTASESYALNAGIVLDGTPSKPNWINLNPDAIPSFGITEKSGEGGEK